ncbi:MAG: hypothetical protein QOG91_710 [Candidatus Parcubacteria bacterium]|jgi:hypothetical protein|nr:hypothetical protein [Candidatus Parcubacteria bacterium]
MKRFHSLIFFGSLLVAMIFLPRISFASPACTDVGLRVEESGFSTPTIVAVEPVGTTPMSPLRIFNGVKTYGIVLVVPGTDTATMARIRLSDGTIMAIGRCAVSLGVSVGAPVFNPQTGLYEQKVTVTNTTVTTISALRVNVGNLRTGVTLFNESGKLADGTSYMQYNLPLSPAQSVTFTAEFYAVDRQAYTASFNAFSASPDPDLVLPPNKIEILLQNPLLCGSDVYSTPTCPRANPYHFPDGTYMLEFSVVPGKIYAIQYSDDSGTTWHTVSPVGSTSSNRIQWIDNGPPKTPSLPTPSRLYKVWEIQ